MLNTGILNLEQLDRPYCCVVQLRTQPPGVIHQVILNPEKVKGNLIRLGETKGDELNGWQFPTSIDVLTILGVAHIAKDDTIQVVPIEEVA